MKTVLIVLSCVFTFASALPYIRDIIKGKTKPRVVSWFTWSLLTGIAAVATFADHQYAAAVLLLFATFETAAITLLGLRHGDRKFERFDIFCQVGAIVGLILWLVFDSPAVAVVATVAIDFVGALPTFKHQWQKPYEETWSAFFLAALGAICTVAATTKWSVTAVVYPLYIVVANVVGCTIILMRTKYAVKGEPAEFRDL